MPVFYAGQQDYIERLNELYAAATGSQAFDFTAFYPGVPTNNALLVRIPVARTVKFNAAFAGSIGKAGTAAAAQADFTISQNGASVGTMRFAAGANTAIFIAANPVTFIAGDILTITAPSTADLTLANIGLVLSGTR